MIAPWHYNCDLTGKDQWEYLEVDGRGGEASGEMEGLKQFEKQLKNTYYAEKDRVIAPWHYSCDLTGKDQWEYLEVDGRGGEASGEMEGLKQFEKQLKTGWNGDRMLRLHVPDDLTMVCSGRSRGGILVLLRWHSRAKVGSGLKIKGDGGPKICRPQDPKIFSHKGGPSTLSPLP